MKKNSVRSAGVFLLAAAILTLAGCSASAAEAGMAAGAKRETESLSMDDSVMDSRTGGGHDDKWGGFTHDLFGGRMLLGD